MHSDFQASQVHSETLSQKNNPSTQEAEASRSLSLQPAWSISQHEEFRPTRAM